MPLAKAHILEDSVVVFDKEVEEVSVSEEDWVEGACL